MNYFTSLFQLAFPHVCEGCGNSNVRETDQLCLRCHHQLPFTDFQFYPANPVEKLFWGRLQISCATAEYYFTKGSMIQHLMHQFKYRKNQKLGLHLGRLMGQSLLSSNRFSDIDAIIPLPLHKTKEHRRGFNQAGILCNGISQVSGIPVLDKAVDRLSLTETQTKKSRVERWQNMGGKFAVVDCKGLQYKHVLLVDDVITTGATLEACGQELLREPGLRLSVAALCYSSRN